MNAIMEALSQLRLPELQAKYAEVLGKKTRCPNKTHLVRKISESLAAEPAPSIVPSEPHTSPTAPVESAPQGTHPDEPAPPATGAQEAEDTPHPVKLTKLSVPELQALHLEVIGRDTRSSARAYLINKIRLARKGQVSIGPKSQRKASTDFKVVPLRMETAVLSELDEARERLGLKSRTELIRRALHAYLVQEGEADVAELFTLGGA